MRGKVAHLTRLVLAKCGFKTINSQFMLTYAIMFVCAIVTVFSLYESMGESATDIDIAGRQRMLSQRMAKEAFLVVDQLERREVLEKTINLF